MEYEAAVRFVFGFTNYELTPLTAASAATLALERVRALLARLGDPQRGRHTVHITGSKGKGSTARLLAALLAEATDPPLPAGSPAALPAQNPSRTGLFTSPHLHSPRERIMIDGEPISREAFARLVAELRPQVEAENQHRRGAELTTFELLTALAFLAFREQGCTWQVVEVGLGGRLDSTNVLDEKDLCIFTPISLEHTAILGPTTAAIAADKAGILRRGCRAVLAPQDADAEAVLRHACAVLGVPTERVAGACAWSREATSLDGQVCRVQTRRARYRFWLPLLGPYQVENAATALLALENLAAAGVRLTPEQVERGLAGVRWPGRLEVLAREPLLIVDGAHNAASAARLAEALRELAPVARWCFLIGALADKDLAGIVAALAPLARTVIGIQPRHPRGRPAGAIARAFESAGVPVQTRDTVAAGLADALALAQPDGALCVTGSLSVVAEARASLLGIEQEPLD